MRLVCFLVLLMPVLAHAQSGYPECKSKFEQGKDAGIIHRMEVRENGITLVVSENLWHKFPFTTKLGMVKVAGCTATQGEAGRLFRIVVRSDMTNKILGEGPLHNFQVK